MVSKRDDLLSTRICDLKLNLQTSPLFSRIRTLYDELAERNLRFRPPCYFADEWFVPEGDPVIGIPFFLASKQLTQLERRRTGEAEGATRRHFMKLLRHEAGHAISYAFNLHRSKDYRRVFGSSSKPFHDQYRFNPRSKKFVINLDDHYAQSHPDEDFAETFAVWLAESETVWRKRYRGWSAVRKLEMVARMMKDIEHQAPLVRDGEKMCHVSTLKYTLRTHYMRRRSLAFHQSERHW
jgi:hypothetical protein